MKHRSVDFTGLMCIIFQTYGKTILQIVW